MPARLAEGVGEGTLTVGLAVEAAGRLDGPAAEIGDAPHAVASRTPATTDSRRLAILTTRVQTGPVGISFGCMSSFRWK